MQSTRYVARVEFLERVGMCSERKDMRSAPGKPRFVECAICKAMLDLGTIDKGISAFHAHLILRHVPQEVSLFELEDEEDVQHNEDADDEGKDGEGHSTEFQGPEDEVDEGQEDGDSFDEEEEGFSDEDD